MIIHSFLSYKTSKRYIKVSKKKLKSYIKVSFFIFIRGLRKPCSLIYQNLSGAVAITAITEQEIYAVIDQPRHKKGRRAKPPIGFILLFVASLKANSSKSLLYIYSDI